MTEVELLRWRLDIGDERAHLIFYGEMDMHAIGPLQEAIDAVLEAGLPVTVDLAAVTFLDGGGLRELMDLAQTIADGGVKVSYGRTGRSVDRYLDLSATRLVGS